MAETPIIQLPLVVPTPHPDPTDWSFAGLSRSETLRGPHGYHRYPAKFIPQLVERLIVEYSTPGDLVADPFLGSGTSGVEALRLGRRFWGADINPVSVLISQAKCAAIPPHELEMAWSEVSLQLARVPHVGRRPLTADEKAIISAIDIARASPEERLTYWFPAPHRGALDQLLQTLLSLPAGSVRTFFLCAFSNILRGCSIWLSGSTKPQKDLGKLLSDPVGAFYKQVRDMSRRNRLYWGDLACSAWGSVPPPGAVTLAVEDARHLPLEGGTLDLLVTSPPYATCYQYIELHQLTQLFLEAHGVLNDADSRRRCIGAKHLGERGTTATAATVATGSAVADAALDELSALATGTLAGAIRQEVRALRHYFQDMHAVIQEFARVVAAGKRMALVVGDSTKRGVAIPTAAALQGMACANGFDLEKKIVRTIPGRVLVSTRNGKTGRFASAAESDIRAYPEEEILVFTRRV